MRRLRGAHQTLTHSFRNEMKLPSNLHAIAQLGVKYILNKQIRSTSEHCQDILRFTDRLAVADWVRHTYPNGSKPLSKDQMKFYVRKNRKLPAQSPEVIETLKIIREFASDFEIDHVNTKAPFHPKLRIRNLIEQSVRRDIDRYYNNEQVRIIECDKGMGLSYIGESTYQDQCLSHLQNKENYKVISMAEVDQLIVNMQTWYKNNHRKLPIDKIGQTFIYDAAINTKWTKKPTFRILAKVHKTPHKSRPIASASKWISQPLAMITASFLSNNYFGRLPHAILRNSVELTEVLNRLNHDVPDMTGYLLCSLDVEALYPSVNIHRLLQLLSDTFKNTQGGSTLLDGWRKTLTSMVVSFQGISYQQTGGLPMGSSDSVVFANFYLHHLLDQSTQVKCTEQLRHFSRFVDDGFCFWKGTRQEWKEWVKVLNDTILPGSLFFTEECQEKELKFLDLVIYFDENRRLQWRPADKALSTYCYLPRLSMHHPTVFRSFIYGDLRRLMLNSSRESNFDDAKITFRARLLNRGYSDSYLSHIWDQVPYESLAARLLNKSQRFLNNVCQAPKEDIIPLVLTYDMLTASPHFIGRLMALLEPIRSHLPRIVLAWRRGPHLIEEIRRV